MKHKNPQTTINTYDEQLRTLQQEVKIAFNRLDKAVQQVYDCQLSRNLFAPQSSDYNNLTANLETAQTELAKATNAYTGINTNYRRFALVHRADFQDCKEWTVVQETTFLTLSQMRQETYKVIANILHYNLKLR